MKKFGFTLAEILITLGIVGVVAALTAPALVQNAGNAKVGPTLAKISATLENVHEQLLHDEEVSSLSSITTNIDEYFDYLSKYISGSSYSEDFLDETSFEPTAKFYDKTDCTLTWKNMKEFRFSDNISLIVLNNFEATLYQPKGTFKGRYYVTYVDINGIKTGPNTIGKDIFQFQVDRSGQVMPGGSSTYAWLTDNENNKYTATEGNYACNKTVVTKGYGCTGSIFENNMKVVYQ